MRNFFVFWYAFFMGMGASWLEFKGDSLQHATIIHGWIFSFPANNFMIAFGMACFASAIPIERDVPWCNCPVGWWREEGEVPPCRRQGGVGMMVFDRICYDICSLMEWFADWRKKPTSK